MPDNWIKPSDPPENNFPHIFLHILMDLDDPEVIKYDHILKEMIQEKKDDGRK